MSERIIAANPKQHDHKRENGMSTFYHRLPRSENYKENSTSVVQRSREEALKEMEKYNARIPPEVKIIASISKALPGNALTQSLRKNKRLHGESNIKCLNRQGVNPVLTEEQESAIRD